MKIPVTRHHSSLNYVNYVNRENSPFIYCCNFDEKNISRHFDNSF